MKQNLFVRLRAYDLGTPACWTWPGKALDKNGYCYANICVGGRVKRVRVHRVSYELFRGPIPEGLQLDHLCRNKACFNPWHLEAVTPRTNVLRSDNICARNARKTHCCRGHAFTPDNTWVVRAGTTTEERMCKACAQDRHSRRKAMGWKQRETRRGRHRPRKHSEPSSLAQDTPATDV